MTFIHMNSAKQPWYYILLLILAGEGVFLLPFILPRVFRPTVLDVFQISNVELGQCFSAYGIVALIAYLAGGVLADYVAPRKLIASALALTGLGGLYMASYPSFYGMLILYGYWGMTTIFLFWAAMIKATRVWGESNGQGKAFSFLDGGRGLVAAGIASVGFVVLSIFAKETIEQYEFGERRMIFKKVIWVFTCVVFLISLLVFFGLKPKKPLQENTTKETIRWQDVRKLLNIPGVYLMMLVILTGYCGYKVTDILSQYAKDVMGFDEIKAAGIGTILLTIRPIVGFTLGLISDRTQPIRMLVIGFALVFCCSVYIASGQLDGSMIVLFFISTILLALGVYSIRCLYFAIMKEVHIPLALTGTAVGFISVIGYTPDIFMGLVMGYFLDHYPGEQGHLYVFTLLSIISLIGLICSFSIYRLNKKT